MNTGAGSLARQQLLLTALWCCRWLQRQGTLRFHRALILVCVAIIALAFILVRKYSCAFENEAPASGMTQAFLVVGGFLPSCLATGALDTSYAAYGCFFLFPLSYVLWRSLLQSSAAATEQSGHEL